MNWFFRKLFGGGARAKAHAAVQYHEYTIHPRPRKIGGGWSTEALIRKSDGGRVREHVFIRADVCNNEAGAVALIINKAKRLIDQQGDKIFS